MSLAYRRLLCSLSAIGAAGSMNVSQAMGTSTSRIAFLVTFLVPDFAPRVATSLEKKELVRYGSTYCNTDIERCLVRKQMSFLKV